jgi:hypothetical protein
MDGYYSEVHEQLQKMRNKVPATIERLEDLLPLVDQVSVDQKEHFEIETKVFLRRLRDHYGVWAKILEVSERRQVAKVRRIK